MFAFHCPEHITFISQPIRLLSTHSLLTHPPTPSTHPQKNHAFCSALIFPHILNKPQFLKERETEICVTFKIPYLMYLNDKITAYRYVYVNFRI